MMNEHVQPWCLDRVPIGDLQGVGCATAAKLNALGIRTAGELRDMPTKQARAVGAVVLERLVLKLRGEPCPDVGLVELQRKGMAIVRSSSIPMRNFDTMLEVMTAHATFCAEKLHQHSLVAGAFTAFWHTNRHKPDRPQMTASRTTRLSGMSNETFGFGRRSSDENHELQVALP